MSGFVPRIDLLVREVDGETVILDRQADLIHTLNPTASIIWRALQRNTPVQDIARSLMESFEVDAGQAMANVESVVDSFRDLGLLQST